jgi:NAD(P)-dependent dehydrogenase (short-subunit alcohol dehydrogenase family)
MCSGTQPACKAQVVELELTGKTALITGGSRGIGLGMAARFVEAGANVMITSRKADDLAEAAAGLVAGGAAPEQVAWVAAHVGKPEQATTCMEKTLGRFGSIDILVNNAGTNPYFGPMLGIDVVRAQKTFEVNQLSVVVWTAAAVQAGLGSGGRGSGSVINVASIGGLGVEPGIGWYNVTKAAVLHITRQLSFELAPDIRVNALAPGLVKTQLAAALWEGPGEERVAAHIPLRRIGLPDDIATAALFLASDASSWMTGQTMVVDGGSTVLPSGGVG